MLLAATAVDAWGDPRPSLRSSWPVAAPRAGNGQMVAFLARRRDMVDVDISMRAVKPAAYREAVIDSFYRAMRDALGVPQDDQFITITEHEPANFRYGASCLGVARSDDLL